MKARFRQAALFGMLALLLPLVVAQPAVAATATPANTGPATNVVTLDVKAAINSLSSNGPSKGTQVAAYKWLLNLDNTGDPHGANSDLYCHPSSNVTADKLPPLPAQVGTNYVVTQYGYPQGCEWSSIRYAVASPVLSEGTQDDWNPNLALPAFNSTTGRGLPDNCPTVAEAVKPCRYLVSVTAQGYEIGGAHFTVPMTAPGVVKVWLNPYPIPLGTARIKVFSDTAPTDGTWDQTTETSVCATPTKAAPGPGEHCMAGFLAILKDYDGMVSQDFFSNPLCTEYVKDSSGRIVLDAKGRPTPLPNQHPSPPDPTTGYYNPTIPGRCMSDTNGDITIPNLAPNRYDLAVTPYECVTNWNWINPDHLPTYDCGQRATYIQTTTLEGGLDHDIWVMPDDTGLDPELVVGGELVPWVQFGFADPQPSTFLVNPSTCTITPLPTECASPYLANGTGEIKGQLFGAIPYIPGVGALPLAGQANAQSGIKLDRPVDRGWVSLNYLSNGQDFDLRAATVAADSNGYFDVTGLRDGSYLLAAWDYPMDYILDTFNVTIQGGQVIDLGVIPLLGWFARLSGHVFIDTNGNGRMDPGEKGIWNAFVQILNRTNNALEGAGQNVTNTDLNGYYEFTETYPLGLMVINQYFNTSVKTTGITWQACNDTQEHTVIAPMVDVSFNPIIGHCGRIDWGVNAYDSTHQENGAIVATALYDQIRNRYNARQSLDGDFQTGLPGIRTEEYTAINCAKVADRRCRNGEGPGGNDELTGYALNRDGSYMTAETPTPVDGSRCDGPSVVNQNIPCYMTENNGAPATCFPRDANGNPIGYDPNNPNSPNSYDFMTFGGACIETAAASTQVGLGTDCLDGPNCHGVQTVDGNYAMPGTVGDPILHGDSLVRMVTPVDKVLPATPIFAPGTTTIIGSQDRPLFTTTTEQDVNMFNGAQFIPQGGNAALLSWPPSAGTPNQMPLGPLSSPDRNYNENEYNTAPGPDPVCAGPNYTVNVNMTNNPSLATNGGSPLQGATRHTCDWKLFHAASGQSIAPNFHFRTVVDIPLPAHWWGYITDDISLNTDRRSTTIGDVSGIPYVPNGFYDWTGRRVFTVDSDYNGVYESLMPSSELFNCPTPAGTCPNTYRVVGNDPGQPGAANANYNPAFRTISAAFQAWPNMFTPVDTAPSHQVPTLLGPGLQFTYTSPCGLPTQDPQLFAVNKPYTTAGTETLQILGNAFGTSGSVNFTSESGDVQPLFATTWSDHEIDVNVGTFMPAGPGELKVTSATGKSTTNGLTFHVIKAPYTPHILEVGPGKTFDPRNPGQFGLKGFTIQDALDRAATQWQTWGVDQVANHGRSIHDVANDPNERFLVVVYPNDSTDFTPLGTYYENLIVHSPLKLQGVGPGGLYSDGSAVQGSIIDGRFFANTTAGTQQFIPDGEAGNGLDNTEPVLIHWENLLKGISNTVEAPTTNPYPNNINGTALAPIGTAGTGGTAWTGVNDTAVGGGAVVTVLSTKGTASDTFKSAIDGFQISGGDQAGITANINEISGTPGGTLELTAGDGVAGATLVQGGAVFLNGGTDHFQITNNLVRQNSGAYGTIRLGSVFQLDTPAGAVDGGSSHNYDTHISNNTIAFNGGSNLGGAVAVFDDSVGYTIDHNIFCQNFSAEYGGAISHYGYSPNGLIDRNLIFLNGAFDEGGAIMVRSEPGFSIGAAGATPDLRVPTIGSGPVTISHNYIAANMAQDDGGAIRLMVTTGAGLPSDPAKWGLSEIDIVNNMINDNTSAHEGGAISMDDTPVVLVINNTIAKNLTTATGISSNGCPAPAGIATGMNSQALMIRLNSQYAGFAPAGGWPSFGKPQIVNDIFWDNRAGSWSSAGVTGIGLGGDSTQVNTWDIGTIDGSGRQAPTHSILSSSADPAGVGGGGCNGSGYMDDSTNQVHPITYTHDPLSGLPVDDNFVKFAAEYDMHLQIVQQRTYFRFRPAAVISLDLPANAIGDYHLAALGGSPAQCLPDDVRLICMGNNSAAIVPTDDIDGNARPTSPNPVDIGAHQLSPLPPAAPTNGTQQ